VESEDRRGLFRDAEGISQSLEDLIAASEPQETFEAGIMGSIATMPEVTASLLHGNCGLDTIDCGLNHFSSGNIGVHEKECLDESMAQASKGIFAHHGYVHSDSEDVQDSLIAAEDWLEVTQALGT